MFPDAPVHPLSSALLGASSRPVDPALETASYGRPWMRGGGDSLEVVELPEFPLESAPPSEALPEEDTQEVVLGRRVR